MAPKARQLSLVDPSILRLAILDSFRKLAPHLVAKNPVMFVVEIGSVLTTARWLRDVFSPSAGAAPTWFTLAVSIWLWFTVLFASFAEAVAEGRGKAQADTLRRMRQDTVARKLRYWPEREDVPGISNEDIIPATRLRKGDIVEGRCRPAHPRRRRGDRGHRFGGRIGHHRRVGARHPRERWRPQRRDRRHESALRPPGGAHHQQPRRVVPRSHDRAGRFFFQAEDGIRDRAAHPARRLD